MIEIIYFIINTTILLGGFVCFITIKMQNKKRKDNLLKIINSFGVIPQIEKLKEEVWEVIDAIYNKERKDIAEEIADVKVVLEQLQVFYEIPEEAIEEIKDKKIKRTLERIESRYYEKEQNKNAAYEKVAPAKEEVNKNNEIKNIKEE